MCHSRGLNNRINNLHERALRIVYQDKKLDFETLVKNDKSVTIHVRNLHYLVTEVYKVKNSIWPEIMRDIFHFQENENYNLKSGVLESLFNKDAGLKTCCFIKKRLQHRCFPVKFAKL